MTGEADTSRLEAFSDGVFAIAITLLILEVKVPSGEGSLAHRLGEAWPSYVSFLISFAVIGTMWLNHHNMFRLIRTVEHGVTVANLFLLLVISAVPFPTKLVGDELANGGLADERTATIVYGLTFMAAAIAFAVLWLAASRDGGRLLVPGLSRTTRLAQTRRNLLGFPIFGIATLVALWSPVASLAVFGALTLAYLLPSGPVDRLLVRGAVVDGSWDAGRSPRRSPSRGVGAPRRLRMQWWGENETLGAYLSRWTTGRSASPSRSASWRCSSPSCGSPRSASCSSATPSGPWPPFAPAPAPGTISLALAAVGLIASLPERRSSGAHTAARRPSAP